MKVGICLTIAASTSTSGPYFRRANPIRGGRDGGVEVGFFTIENYQISIDRSIAY
jgi:hypothetical protein